MKRILIIDEDNHEAKRIENLLSEIGYKIYVAEKETDGFEIAKRYLPDLIFCSTTVKDPNGSNIIADLINFEDMFVIPLIILTENSNILKVKKYMNYGVDDFFDRSFSDDYLVSTVKARIKKYEAIKNRYQKFNFNRFEEEEKDHDHDDHILVKIGNRLNFIKFSNIICVTALKEYSQINLENNKKIVVRKSLKKWNEVLPSDIFLQIHRSTIINLDFIEDAKKINGRSYQIKMKCIEEDLILSKRFANKIRKKIPFL